MPSENNRKGEIVGTVAAYGDVAEHIQDELSRLDLLLAFAGSSPGQYRNGSRPGSESQNAKSQARHGDSSLLTDIQAKDESIAARLAASNQSELPLLRLQSLFDLSPLEYSILIICIAPAVDPHYGQSYAGLNLSQRPCATPGLVARLLGALGEGVAAVRECCSAHAPLFRFRLLEFRPAAGVYHLLETPVAADERIVDYVLGGRYLDSAGVGFLFNVQAGAEQVALARESVGVERLEAMAGRLAQNVHESTLIFLQGPKGSPFRETAGALCQRPGYPLLRLDCARLSREAADPRAGLARALREAILFQGALLLEDFFCRECADQGLQDAFLEETTRLPGIYFIAGESGFLDDRHLDCNFRTITLALPLPDFETRARLWRRGLAAQRLEPEGVTVEELASAFRFTSDQIRGAILHARDELFFQASGAAPESDPALGESTALPAAGLFAGCRAVSNRGLTDLAVRLPAKFTYDDIVLRRDSLQHLFDIENHVRYAETVYGDWGFEGRILSGRGLNVLFSGVSGTGKTMAASILAGQLRLELFRIDLSTVVSKYIGETEKNLGRIFHEAETSNAILFFDEADALFGKRSEVKDAHDRNANIEVGYLLQKMEEYSGMSILASNLRENIDEAFLRRLHFIVEFPFPGPTERSLIWDAAIPDTAPRAADLSLEFLGERIKLAGGGIKNVALGAAFLAARENGAISMRHVLTAARREYEKDGRTLLPSDLGEYGALLAEVDD